MKLTAEGNYGDIGRSLNKQVSEAFKDDPVRNHFLMVTEHLLGAFVERRGKSYSVVMTINTESQKVTFTATPKE